MVSMSKQHEIPSYLTPSEIGPWGVYLEQIDRVTPTRTFGTPVSIVASRQ